MAMGSDIMGCVRIVDVVMGVIDGWRFYRMAEYLFLSTKWAILSREGALFPTTS